jgi:hypothetical protein
LNGLGQLFADDRRQPSKRRPQRAALLPQHHVRQEDG